MKNPSVRPLRSRSKPQELSAALDVYARRLGPGAKLPTVTELRRLYDVSVNTLNGALIELEAQGVLTRKHGVGIYVSADLPKQTRNIALICYPRFFQTAGHSPFWDILLHEVERRKLATGENIQLHFTSPMKEDATLDARLTEDLKTGHIDGVLAIGVHNDIAFGIENQGIPLVSYAGHSSYVVTHNDFGLLEMGLRELKKQGCKRIATWMPIGPYRYSDPADTPYSKEQVEKVRVLYEKVGVEYYPELLEMNFDLVCPIKRETRVLQQEQGYRAAMKFFSEPSLCPDGVVSSDDVMTHGALLALDKRGLQVGQDVLVASHSNRGSTVLMGREEQLILMEVNPSDIVETMFSALEMLLQGQTPEYSCLDVQPHLKR